MRIVNVCCLDECDLKFYLKHGMNVMSEAIVEDDGAIKWSSNNRYLMKDTMERIQKNGFTGFSVEATNKKRDIQNEEFLTKYRKNYLARSLYHKIALMSI